MKLIKMEKVKDGRYLKNYELTYENKAGKEKKYEIVSRRELSSVEDIGKSTQHLTHKEELLASQQTFYEREKEEVRELLRAYYSDTSDKAKVTAKLQQYTERYHKKNNPMYSDSSLFDKGFVNLMVQ